MSDQPSGGRRIYLGRLPADVRKGDVEDFFSPIKFADCRVMGAFGFVEFETSRDADDAVRDYANKKLLGAEIIVEKAKDNPNRQRRDYGGGDSYSGDRGGGGGGYGAPQQRRGPAPGRGVRVAVKGLTPDISWQDLKDFGREGGAVIYADVDRAGGGVIEYATMGEAETALDRLSTQEIRNIKPTVTLDESRGGYRGGDDRGGYSGGRDRDPYQRDRRPSPPRGGYGDRGGGSDRRYDDRRDRDRSPRRGDRDRSPPRRDYDRDSRRSPPPREYRRGDDRDYR